MKILNNDTYLLLIDEEAEIKENVEYDKKLRICKIKK